MPADTLAMQDRTVLTAARARPAILAILEHPMPVGQVGMGATDHWATQDFPVTRGRLGRTETKVPRATSVSKATTGCLGAMVSPAAKATAGTLATLALMAKLAAPVQGDCLAVRVSSEIRGSLVLEVTRATQAKRDYRVPADRQVLMVTLASSVSQARREYPVPPVIRAWPDSPAKTVSLAILGSTETLAI